MQTFSLLEVEPLATGRNVSLFQGDVDDHRPALAAALGGRAVAVIGAAGSIGAAVVESVLAFRPSAMTLIDLNENNLVELVRDLRARPDVSLPERFAALPIGLGSCECSRFFAEAPPFDFVLNLSALKHVRSEKDVYSLMRMVDTNVLFLDELLTALDRGRTKVFSVSTDKATGPANMMGASKRIMEMVLQAHSDSVPFSTARFANVAFSDGSLPFAMLRRIEKRQPIAAPNDVRRFFISHAEAGQLCLLAAVVGGNRECFFPELEAGTHEKTLSSIAVSLLATLGYEPYECSSEEEARGRAAELIPTGKWPCLFAGSDTSGEKPYEEFVAPGDDVERGRFRAIGVLRYAHPGHDPAGLRSFLDFGVASRAGRASKADYVRAFRALVPDFRHLETGRNLDDKL